MAVVRAVLDLAPQQALHQQLEGGQRRQALHVVAPGGAGHIMAAEASADAEVQPRLAGVSAVELVVHIHGYHRNTTASSVVWQDETSGRRTRALGKMAAESMQRPCTICSTCKVGSTCGRAGRQKGWRGRE